jgi:hypothetical protein
MVSSMFLWRTHRFYGGAGSECLELEEAMRLLLIGSELFVKFTPEEVIWALNDS